MKVHQNMHLGLDIDPRTMEKVRTVAKRGGAKRNIFQITQSNWNSELSCLIERHC